jgi:hypothetical protein
MEFRKYHEIQQLVAADREKIALAQEQLQQQVEQLQSQRGVDPQQQQTTSTPGRKTVRVSTTKYPLPTKVRIVLYSLYVLDICLQFMTTRRKLHLISLRLFPLNYLQVYYSY